MIKKKVIIWIIWGPWDPFFPPLPSSSSTLSPPPLSPFQVFFFPLQFPVRVLFNRRNPSTETCRRPYFLPSNYVIHAYKNVSLLSKNLQKRKERKSILICFYLLCNKSFPPAKLDCRHAKTALTKCKKSAPKGKPTSGQREKISWVTKRSPLPFFLRWTYVRYIIITS